MIRLAVRRTLAPLSFPGAFAIALSLLSTVCLFLVSVSEVEAAFLLASGTISARLVMLVFFYKGRLGDCIHYSVILIYFCIAPGLQWIDQASFWGVPTPSGSSLGSAWAMVSLYCIGFELSGFIRVEAIEEKNRSKLISARRLLYGILIMCGIAILVILANSDYALSPRGESYLLEQRSASYSIFFVIFPKSTLLVSLLCSIYFLFKRRTISAFSLMVLICISCAYFTNPTHTARQQIFIGIFPLFILFIRSNRLRKFVSSLVIIFGLIGVGPILNSIARDRYHGVQTASFPLSADFDAMFNAANISDIFAKSDYGFGRYILNALSFPLPGSLKLFPSFDPLLSDKVYYAFSQSNLSMPPFVTAYLDFGYPGSLLIGVAIGYVVHRASIIVARWPASDSFASALLGALVLASYVPLIRGPIQGMGPFAATMLFAAFVLLRTSKMHGVGRTAGDTSLKPSFERCGG